MSKIRKLWKVKMKNLLKCNHVWIWIFQMETSHVLKLKCILSCLFPFVSACVLPRSDSCSFCQSTEENGREVQGFPLIQRSLQGIFFCDREGFAIITVFCAQLQDAIWTERRCWEGNFSKNSGKRRRVCPFILYTQRAHTGAEQDLQQSWTGILQMFVKMSNWKLCDREGKSDSPPHPK